MAVLRKELAWMDTTIHCVTYCINKIGELALFNFSSVRQGGVLASVTDAIYLQDQCDEIYWLVPQSGPMHQRSIQVASSLPRLRVDTVYKIENLALRFTTGEVLDFARAHVWHPPIIISSEIIPIRKAFEDLIDLMIILINYHHPNGFGQLIARIVHWMNSDAGEWVEEDLVDITQTAWHLIRDLFLTTSAGDYDRFSEVTARLIGLGEGLTPSGDDFLGGYLFALQLLSRYYSESFGYPNHRINNILLRAKSLTNPISYTLLNDHAKGSSVEALHQLANGLVTGVPTQQLYLASQQLISLGHSTGWDILTGFFAAWSVITQNYIVHQQVNHERIIDGN